MRADQLRWALVPAVVVLYLFVALTLALKLNIWLAEPYTLHTTGSGPGYALEQSIHF